MTMKNIFTPRFIFVTIAIFIAAISRVFPHIPNFTPVAAIALFGAVNFSDKRFAFIVPLLAMFISDCILELTTGWGFHKTLVFVYAGFILTSCIGLIASKKPSFLNITAASILSSVIFFVLTNFGTWASGESFFGLGTTFAMGVPFFAPTLLGDLFYNGILFGAFFLVQRTYPALIKA